MSVVVVEGGMNSPNARNRTVEFQCRMEIMPAPIVCSHHPGQEKTSIYLKPFAMTIAALGFACGPRNQSMLFASTLMDCFASGLMIAKKNQSDSRPI